MEKYDAEYDVFDEFVRSVLARYNIRYDEQAWQVLQEKLDQQSVESRGAEKASPGLKNKNTSKDFDIE